MEYQEVPVVDLDLCIGCGICETQCPVSDDPAIYCTSLGESRSLKTSVFMDMLGGGDLETVKVIKIQAVR